MSAAPLAATLRRLAAAEAGDAELLTAFRSRRDEAAFAELVRRYAPLVAGVCRRTLGHSQDAEDAFQAAFLVLARKAHAVTQPLRLAGWLHTVALRAAHEVRSMRQRHRRADSLRPRPEAVTAEATDADLAAVLDEEIARLPEHYRLAILRCEVQGQSRSEAAATLDIPEGTLSSRLAEAKRRLARRLKQRGIVAGAAALAAALAPRADAGWSAARLAGLARSAVALVTGNPAALTVAGPAVAAADAITKSMVVAKLQRVALAAVFAIAVGGGLTLTPGGRGGAIATIQAEEPPARTVPAPDPAALVRALSGAKYAGREEAQRKLRELGGRARSAVRDGVNSDDAEVARRCRALLTLIRADQWDQVRKDLKEHPDKREIDHPVWRRFAEVAGDDAASRKLFADMIDDDNRAKFLDEAIDFPTDAGTPYAAEIKRVAHLCQYGVSKAPELAAKGMVVGAIAYHPANGELASLLFVGTLPATATAAAEEGAGECGMMYGSTYKMGFGPEVRPAMDRLLAAWTAARGHAGAIEVGLELAKNWRLTQMLPVARRLAADEKLPPKVRAEAVLMVGQVGDKSDVPLLRRIAESPAASEPINRYNDIIKGQKEIDALWGRVRMGGPNATPEEWKKAEAAIVRKAGTLTLADCAWAAAVNCAGGKPIDMGFATRWTARGQQGTFPPWAHAYGFDTPATRAAAYAAAKKMLATDAHR